MKTSFVKSLIVALLIFVGANSAQAGIVNNSTSSFTAADSITLSFSLLDSIGSVTALDSAADWFKIFVFNPAGDSVFGESLDVKQANAQIEIYRVATQDAMWTYKREVEDFDGSNVTQNGVWRWYAMARDSSLKLTTSWTGEFQLYTTGDINIKWDSTTQIPTGEITTGSFTAGAIDAAAIAASAIGESELAAGAITTSEIATGAIDDDAVADGAIDWGLELDTNGFGANAQEAASDAIAASDVMLAGDSSTFADHVWTHGTRTLTALDEDATTLDLNGTTIGTVTTVTNSPFSAANAGSVADSVWRKGGAKVRLSDGDTTAIAMLYHIRDSMDEASAASALSAGSMGSIADSVWRKASIGGPAYADGTFGDVIKNDSIAIDAIRDSMDEASQVATGFSTFNPATDSVIADKSSLADLNIKVNSGDTINAVLLGDSLALIHSRLVALLADTSQSLSSADSAMISRISRRMWGIQLGEAGSTDSTTLDQRTVFVDSVQANAINANGIAPSAIGTSEWAAEADNNGINWGDVSNQTATVELTNTLIAGAQFVYDLPANIIGSSELAASGIMEILDSLRASVLSAAEADSLIARVLQIQDSVRSQLWALSGASCGSGPQLDSVLALDTSGTDTPIPFVVVAATDGAGNVWYGNTNGDGWAFLNLASNTQYTFIAFSAGYAFGQTIRTTGSDGTDADTVFGYNIEIGSPSALNLKRVYDDLYTMTGDSIQGALVTAELIMPDSTVIPYDTSSGVSLGKNPPVVVAMTNASGRWSMDVVPNNYIRPAGSRYRFTVYWNQRRIYSVTVTANGTTSALLRSLQ